MARNPDRSSRHLLLATYRRPDGTTLLEPRLVPVRPATRLHRVRAGDRLDLLAARYLGDPWLAWQIADANPSLDPRELVEPGRVLRIPERQ